MANKKSATNNTGQVIAIGAGVAALGVMSYLLFGSNGKKNQKKLKGWMLKMKGEVMEKMEDAQEMSATVFENIVDEVGKKYKTLKKIDGAELAAEILALKKGWKAVAKGTKKKVSKSTRTVKSVAKKAIAKSPVKFKNSKKK